ncbi:MAG: hypothetical protein MK132_12200 [Lentisphaerales bacterium]|nr:hypothetical protein [Lentisphaerales bacterium]
MSLPAEINKFIDESPISLVATKGGTLSIPEIDAFFNENVKPKVNDTKYGQLFYAGLLMAQDYIWEAHEIVQDYPELEASWWHAFMHRMEGDYGNAGYWYRRVGNNEHYQSLLDAVKKLDFETRASEILGWTQWDSFELNHMIGKSKGEFREELHDVHRLECLLLLKICYLKAVA